MAEKNATLTLPTGEVIDLPVIKDLRTGCRRCFWFTKSRVLTYDPGFMSARNRIKNYLHRWGSGGATTPWIFNRRTGRTLRFLETCFLLWYGHLPNSEEKGFVNNITRHTMVHESLAHFFDGFHHNAHPMAMMCGAVGALSAFYHDVMDIRSERDREIAAHRLVPKCRRSPRCATSTPPTIYVPAKDFSYAANFLYMMFGTPCEEYLISKAVESAMDRILLLHADHEQNASTSTVRLAGSTGANPFACISSGIAALWGPHTEELTKLSW